MVLYVPTGPWSQQYIEESLPSRGFGATTAYYIDHNLKLYNLEFNMIFDVPLMATNVLRTVPFIEAEKGPGHGLLVQLLGWPEYNHDVIILQYILLVIN